MKSKLTLPQFTAIFDTEENGIPAWGIHVSFEDAQGEIEELVRIGFSDEKEHNRVTNELRNLLARILRP
jgi:hypothetical protein